MRGIVLGPVLFSLSSSGTVFAISVAKYYKDEEFLDGLMKTVEQDGALV